MMAYSDLYQYRTRRRSLVFLLQVAARRVFPDYVLRVRYDVPRGYYCELCYRNGQAGEQEQVKLLKMTEILLLKQEMKRLVEENLPITARLMSRDEAASFFLAQNEPQKAELILSLRAEKCPVFTLCGVSDTLHGELVSSTGELGQFDLNSFGDGFCLRYEMYGRGSLLPNYAQLKISQALHAHSKWCESLGISGVGSLNNLIQDGRGSALISLCEARHERQCAVIAEAIKERRDSVKVVFIAGPSSSGKTSTALRLAQQFRVSGLNPKVIELDNYFKDRADTPRDENGEYDFESLGAMRIDLLNDQLTSLFAGESVEIPRYDFARGEGVFEGNFLKLEKNDILIMEGIHALNPEMVPGIDSTRIYRVYASALTSLNVDENVCISTTDNRLLRRIVRDNRVRSTSPEATLLRWPSVRRGENRNIFPFQENADVYFNSALIYELPLLKAYAEPLLRQIPGDSPAYPEAERLLSFLSYLAVLPPKDLAAIPPTSIIREFVGGQILSLF